MRVRLVMSLFVSTFLAACGSLGICGIDRAIAAEPLQAGMAVVDITPPLGFRMSGYFSERLSTGVKDPLLAKAIVFGQGDRRAALVFCDLVGISLDVSTKARERIEREIGIPVANVAISATHSHTGPMYFGALREHFHRKAVAAHGSDPYEKVDYPATLVGKLVDAVRQALQVMAPVRISAGYAHEDRLSFNRRFEMKNGTVRFNPGQLNPDIVRPVGPIDPEVGLVKLESLDRGEPMAALVAFALHLDTLGGTEYSADYPYFLQRELRNEYGPKFISLFGAGTCGDINHIDVTKRERRKTEEIGTMLAATVAKRLPELAPIEEPSLAVRRAFVNAPLQQYGEKQVAEARRKMEQVDSRQVPFLERVEAYKIMALQLRDGKTLPMEVQAFRLSSDVVLVTLPGEVFVELGMAIKQSSPFETTILIELTNDTPGYIPTRRAFAEGHYEPTNSRVQPGGGEMMVETAIRLLRELAPEDAASGR